MVPKLGGGDRIQATSFRAVLFRMVPKPPFQSFQMYFRFRAVLFRMVPKPVNDGVSPILSFRAVLFRMVPKQMDVRKFSI